MEIAVAWFVGWMCFVLGVAVLGVWSARMLRTTRLETSLRCIFTGSAVLSQAGLACLIGCAEFVAGGLMSMRGFWFVALLGAPLIAVGFFTIVTMGVRPALGLLRSRQPALLLPRVPDADAGDGDL